MTGVQTCALPISRFRVVTIAGVPSATDLDAFRRSIRFIVREVRAAKEDDAYFRGEGFEELRAPKECMINSYAFELDDQGRPIEGWNAVALDYLRHEFPRAAVTCSSADAVFRVEITEGGNTYGVVIRQRAFEDFEDGSSVVRYLAAQAVVERLRAAGTGSVAMIEGLGQITVQTPP